MSEVSGQVLSVADKVPRSSLLANSGDIFSLAICVPDLYLPEEHGCKQIVCDNAICAM